ncbi:MAG TPA: bifunctional UDP-3-O-[3-hydroxymyristoyl] N-acetylglucosamine deacetylase/3-hydroxyacyl-ACP dehydratase [Bacteroidales bacterium]|nr:bifunctional UDP-3-O-[3-hydroxymyristoyl] N-acetylglucosamine deacetylase/3-hydroxyacyl-ACP dehydratase [Bacteroidales bacterium]HPT02370.1 bifunctional UDP-3-O-[3-hydroxymyristoyl] N-acetylglucosamine deacetylase/3-hydroxyacyl-ACP dehydratase [Bacteroidales bacterium]
MVEKQCTIKQPVSLSGAGLHSGKDVTLTFRPAEAGHGIKFRRIDMDGQPVIDAIADYVVDTSRGTTIQHQGVRVATIEHTLAAVVGMGIDNILIDVDSPEMPIMDGSAAAFAEALSKAGIVEQDADREYFEAHTTLTYSDPHRKSEMILVPEDNFRVSTMIDFETRILGTQYASIDDISNFRDEIANCRTFVFLHELEYLISNNLIKGGDINNAIVFIDRLLGDAELDRLAKYFNKDKIEVLKEGILNNLELRHHNEPARHKLLDVIGDLALIGMRIKGHVIATRPGHAVNTSFAKLVRDQVILSKQKPTFDIFKTPVYDINDIRRFLPHRPPFLLIDKIIEISDNHVVGVKNVTMNEPHFTGHFPEEPVMPGVLQLEAMAQTGGILALHNVPDPENYATYFLKIDNVKFRHKVVPGDTLLLSLELISPVRRGIFHTKANAFVNNVLVTEAELVAQITRKKTVNTDNNTVKS